MTYGEQCIYMRDHIKGINGDRKPIQIRLDNNFIVREDTMCVKWDDEHEILSCFYRTKGVAVQNVKPITVEMFNYDQIQGMKALYDMEEFENSRELFGLTENQIKNVLNFINIELKEYMTGTLDSQNHTHSIPTGSLDT
jgi:hypothetical protein